MTASTARPCLTASLTVAILMTFAIWPKPVHGSFVKDASPDSVPFIPSIIDLKLHHSKVFSYEGLTRVAVGDPAIADVRVLGQSEFLVNGVGQGDTTLMIWGIPGYRQAIINVYERDRPDAHEVENALGLSGVEVRWVGDSLVLEGTVATDEASEVASKIAGAYWDNVINLIDVYEPAPPDANELKRLIGAPDVKIDLYGETLVLTGTVASEDERGKIESAARAFYSNVVNLVDVEHDIEDNAVISLTVQQKAGGDEPGAHDGDEPVANELSELQRLGERVGVEISEFGEYVLLEGEVASENVSNSLEAGLRNNGRPVVNLLDIRRTPEKQPPVSDIEIEELIDREWCNVLAVGNTLIVEGIAPDEFEKRRAEELAGLWQGKLVSLITIEEEKEPAIAEEAPSIQDDEEQKNLKPDSSIIDRIGDAIGSIDGIDIRIVDDALVLDGTVSDENQAKKAETLARLVWPKVVNVIEVERDVEDREPKVAFDVAETDSDVLGLVEGSLAEIGVSLQWAGSVAVLRGEVGSNELEEQAIELARLCFDEVVSMISIVADESETIVEPQPRILPDLPEISSKINNPGIELDLAGDTILIEGTVTDGFEFDRAEKIVRSYWPKYINILRVDPENPKQVRLKVTIAEVDSTLDRNLGIDWNEGISVDEEIVVDSPWKIGTVSRTTSLAEQIQLYEKEGYARTLARPNIVALENQEVHVFSGGQVPVPASSNTEDSAMEWKDHGVELSVVADVLDNSQIQLSLKSSVSTLDWANGTIIEDMRIPALKSRTLDTVVVVPDGHTVVIGGLLQHQERSDAGGIAGLRNLPVIGNLFNGSGRSYKRNDLMILVTPEIVDFEEEVSK